MEHPLKSTLSMMNHHGKDYLFFDLTKLNFHAYSKVLNLPYSIRILLEGVMRNWQSKAVSPEHAQHLLNWQPDEKNRVAVPFFPGRVILQDFTGVPVINDLTAMRAAVKRAGGNPLLVNPVIPVDLVIDHSIMVDYAGRNDALTLNTDLEFNRNIERYQFLKWSSAAFNNLRIIPPSSGIVHQINLEYLARSVLTSQSANGTLIFPETLVGTDSHTTMINGLGILGWGVGGIEAVAAMMGEPLELIIPDVIGVNLRGELPDGVTPTDLTLFIIHKLRQLDVVDKFVEFYGDGLQHLSISDRAMISNISPESGATMIFFPVDDRTLEFLKITARDEHLVNLAENYFKINHLFRDKNKPVPNYTMTINIDLDHIEPAVAGPKRPQDRVSLKKLKERFEAELTIPKQERGFGLKEIDRQKTFPLKLDGKNYSLSHGFLAIAAITSCTNTSNPTVMIAAGLLARNAVNKGLHIPAYVKTSFAPGSRVVSDYLDQAGLMEPLNQLGFNVVGYGCTTCIGNSGPIDSAISAFIEQNPVVAASILSGNRNFEGRVHSHTIANYLASPPLVIAFALAGTVNINLDTDPLGFDRNNQPVYLSDIWPSNQEIKSVMDKFVRQNLFLHNYKNILAGNEQWNSLTLPESEIYPWSPDSTYLKEPPFFHHTENELSKSRVIEASILAIFGDSITTDHISPAGSIPLHSPAGEYLTALGIQPQEFNAYGARRGNHELMVRGAFANLRLKNLMLPGVEGGKTIYLPSNQIVSIYQAATMYKNDRRDLVILAGREYGSGSSRDWAAKGPALLGVKAIIAQSFERIHRSNLAGMGILPLQFLAGETVETLGLNGQETITIHLPRLIKSAMKIKIEAEKPDGEVIVFFTTLRIDTPVEIQYFKDGGLMNTILKGFLK